MPKRVSPDDPNRCRAPVEQGQCPYESVEDTDYCTNHDGGRQLAVVEQRNYLIGQGEHLQKIRDMNTPEVIHTLDAEIAANAMMLKLTMDRTQNDDELILQRPVIQSLSRTLLQLKKANAEMERFHGQVLSLPAVARLASRIVEIAMEVIKDLPDVEERSDQLIALVSAELDLLSTQNQNRDGEF